MAINRKSIQFRTRQTVIKEISTEPYVGYEHPTDIPKGFTYDIKRWSSPLDLKLPTLSRLSEQSIQGINITDYFLSGVASVDIGDLFIQRINEIFDNDEVKWIPEVRPGYYFRYNTKYYYYGNESIIQYIDSSENIDNRNYIELSKIPNQDSPILVSSFTRDINTKAITYYKQLKQVYKFTGLYENGEEKQTITDTGQIIWDNVDINKREFLVDHTVAGSNITKLYLNKDYIETIGVTPSVYQDLGACEYLGLSTGITYQVFYLKYFPVVPESLDLYIANSSDSTWEKWQRIDTWWDLITTNYTKSYFLDKDLGIIYFGSALNGGIPPVGTNIVASYDTTIRVEYEEKDQKYVIDAFDADVSPITQSLNQGFVVITHEDIEAANISLSINKVPIKGTRNPTEYGPISIGSDYAILTATITNFNGSPVPDKEVTFTMYPTDVGYIGGSSTDISVSNTLGNAYTNYQPPTSANDLGFYSTTVRDTTNPYYPGDKELIIKLEEIGLENKEDDIYLYHILKDDPVYGYETLDDYLFALYQEDTPTWVIDAETYSKWKTEMILKYDLKDWQTPEEGKPIEGRKVIVYQNTENPYAIDPTLGTYGAYVPVRPYLVEKINDAGDIYNGYYRLIYPADALLDIGVSDIGGYWIVSSKVINFKAECWSPYYNRTITSNEITTRITLPKYLLGEYINSISEKVPFGWKLLSNDNVAAGLDGATFITINPNQGPYEIIDLVGGTGGTGVWTDGASQTLGFYFNII